MTAVLEPRNARPLQIQSYDFDGGEIIAPSCVLTRQGFAVLWLDNAQRGIIRSATFDTSAALRRVGAIRGEFPAEGRSSLIHFFAVSQVDGSIYLGITPWPLARDVSYVTRVETEIIETDGTIQLGEWRRLGRGLLQALEPVNPDGVIACVEEFSTGSRFRTHLYASVPYSTAIRVFESVTEGHPVAGPFRIRKGVESSGPLQNGLGNVAAGGRTAVLIWLSDIGGAQCQLVLRGLDRERQSLGTPIVLTEDILGDIVLPTVGYRTGELYCASWLQRLSDDTWLVRTCEVDFAQEEPRCLYVRTIAAGTRVRDNPGGARPHARSDGGILIPWIDSSEAGSQLWAAVGQPAK